MSPGAQIKVLGGGIHADVPTRPPGQALEVTFNVQRRGLESFSLVPLGRQTTVVLDSSWQHPSFVGKYLPTNRSVSESGFHAEWATSHFATGLQEEFAKHFTELGPNPDLNNVNFGVNLIDPVDLYTQADRAMKYGFLFVVLTFVALLGTEMWRGQRGHPVQYTMVGVALTLFFLLLLSLAEHIGFGNAYLTAAGVSVGVLGYYVRHALRSVGVGLAFTASLSVLYTILYGLLSAADFALLTGAVFVFSALAVMMVLTRNVGWYARTQAIARPVVDGKIAEPDATS